MKKFVLAAVCFTSIHACGFSEHNGINFNMTELNVLKKGFTCNPFEKPSSHTKLVCTHGSMRGEAFGYSTHEYEVLISADGKVDRIKADFIGPITKNYIDAIRGNIEREYPKRSSHRKSPLGSGSTWLAPNNVQVVLIYIAAGGERVPASASISFYSSRVYVRQQEKAETR